MKYSIFETTRKTEVPHKDVEKTIELTLRAVKRPKSTVSVHLIGDKKMRTINNQFRGKDKTTDVLSFSAIEGEIIAPTDDLGDIFVCIPQIRRQAPRFGATFKQEFHRMLIHGILHIVGYDHMQEADAKKMFGLQEKLLTKRGV